jgi:hypothetical protein
MKNIFEQGVIIKENRTTLFGILRRPEISHTVVIFLPVFSGTRIGPQRIYVEISRELLKNGIASLSIDLPLSGDSFLIEDKNFQARPEKEKIYNYAYFLKMAIDFLKNNFSFNEYIIVSISLGCLPALDFSKQHHFRKIILLSPNHFETKLITVDRKNLKSYLYKLFIPVTWKKMFFLKINFVSIFKNVFNVTIHRKKKNESPYESKKSDDIEILCIYGEKDNTLNDCLKYWNDYLKNGKCKSLHEKTVSGSDHSFYGWIFKKDVSTFIVDWLS